MTLTHSIFSKMTYAKRNSKRFIKIESYTILDLSGKGEGFHHFSLKIQLLQTFNHVLTSIDFATQIITIIPSSPTRIERLFSFLPPLSTVKPNN